jgi:ankyrin repeat protein
MRASENGHHDVVRTLLEGGADINAKSDVRNQMIMMMMLMMIIMMAVNENYN